MILKSNLLKQIRDLATYVLDREIILNSKLPLPFIVPFIEDTAAIEWSRSSWIFQSFVSPIVQRTELKEREHYFLLKRDSLFANADASKYRKSIRTNVAIYVCSSMTESQVACRRRTAHHKRMRSSVLARSRRSCGKRSTRQCEISIGPICGSCTSYWSSRIWGWVRCNT